MRRDTDPDRHPWRGAVAAIGTKHGKLDQFAPPLREHLELHLRTADIDTDLLGTFTGEVERSEPPLDTARQKARWAIETTGASIGLGSEGSYGPHPDVPSLAIGVEVAVCLHPTSGVEVVEHVLDTNPMWAHVDVRTLPVPPDALRSVGFPTHALVVSSPGEPHLVRKGLRSREDVDRAVARCMASSGWARIQVDLRAHLNPTRQRTLARLAERLAQRAARRCPACGAPGWGVVEVELGLPCAWCTAPTQLMRARTLGCGRRACTHRARTLASDLAPAAACPICNP